MNNSQTAGLYAWAPDALSRRVGTTVLVTRLADPMMHELSGGAFALWGELAVPHTMPELVARIARSHGLEERQIDGQVRECLEALLALGVVRARNDPDG